MGFNRWGTTPFFYNKWGRTPFLRAHPLAVIVFAQVCGTSLWFSINGVWLGMADSLALSHSDLGRLTLAVQAGFITGTLVLAVSGLADRFRASRIFLTACLLGALVNAAFVWVAGDPALNTLLRFLTGMALGGIYPLGMKLVISWTPKHTGAALSWLVGMLTLGTALPHLLLAASFDLHWQWPLLASSVLALVGGLVIYGLGEGEHLPARSPRVSLKQGLAALRSRRFLAVAGGYFGHCWELYAFWMLAPLLVAVQVMRLEWSASWVPWLAFAIIGIGLWGCVMGGWLSRRWGSYSVARIALVVSGALCLLYPLLTHMPPLVLIALLLIWGFMVIADSPQFSAMAAASAPQDRVGASLAVMNAIGFALTIPPIYITSLWWTSLQDYVIWLLLPGPILGLIALHRYSHSGE